MQSSLLHRTPFETKHNKINIDTVSSGSHQNIMLLVLEIGRGLTDLLLNKKLKQSHKVLCFLLTGLDSSELE